MNNENYNIANRTDKKVLLSAIWVFAVLNYLYCDVLALMDSNLLNQFLTGTVDGMKLTQNFLFGASILMEISISMTLLSRLLSYRVNRIANLIASTITTLVQIATLIGKPTMYYIFFSLIEIAATSSIFIIALKWKVEKDEQLKK